MNKICEKGLKWCHTSNNKKYWYPSSMVVQACNFSTQEAEAEGSWVCGDTGLYVYQIQGQPELLD
jgi:hypothetical protein